jgi:hypothetical protein
VLYATPRAVRSLRSIITIRTGAGPRSMCTAVSVPLAPPPTIATVRPSVAAGRTGYSSRVPRRASHASTTPAWRSGGNTG